MSKGPGSVYDKWNISVVIFDTDGYISNHQINMTITHKQLKSGALEFTLDF
jgi:hypothetical protein